MSVAMSIAGMNTSDPLDHSLRFYNRHGAGNIDPLMLGGSKIFFTRPDLNFRSGINIRFEPIFEFYSGTELGQKLMGMLMSPFYPYNYNILPELGIGDKSQNDKKGFILEPKKLVHSPFIPLLSNTCTESSGTKDLIIESYDTQGDYSGTKTTYARGSDETQTVSDISLSFGDVFSGPVSLLFFLWMTYIHDVGKGLVKAHPHHIFERVIDYTSSIYIFMLGPDQKTIVRFVKYTGCYPTSLSLGAVQHTKDLTSESLRNVSVTMRYNRMEYMNPKILGDFNTISDPFINFSADAIKAPGHHLTRQRQGGGDLAMIDDVFMASHWHRHPSVSGNKLIYLNNNLDVLRNQRDAYNATRDRDDWDKVDSE